MKQRWLDFLWEWFFLGNDRGTVKNVSIPEPEMSFMSGDVEVLDRRVINDSVHWIRSSLCVGLTDTKQDLST